MTQETHQLASQQAEHHPKKPQHQPPHLQMQQSLISKGKGIMSEDIPDYLRAK